MLRPISQRKQSVLTADRQVKYTITNMVFSEAATISRQQKETLQFQGKFYGKTTEKRAEKPQNISHNIFNSVDPAENIIINYNLLDSFKKNHPTTFSASDSDADIS